AIVELARERGEADQRARDDEACSAEHDVERAVHSSSRGGAGLVPSALSPICGVPVRRERTSPEAVAFGTTSELEASPAPGGGRRGAGIGSRAVPAAASDSPRTWSPRVRR